MNDVMCSKRNFVEKRSKFLHDHLLIRYIFIAKKKMLIKTNLSIVKRFFQNNSCFEFLSINFFLITQ